ncbi:MAG: S8 family serine peptidase [Planctomycetota bacterium]|jgi:subtilisin family serine protease
MRNDRSTPTFFIWVFVALFLSVAYDNFGNVVIGVPDSPPSQVAIEARIIEITDTYLDNASVEWIEPNPERAKADAPVEWIEPNPERAKADAPNDPYFLGKGSWGQAFDDQWAIKHVGFTAERGSAWDIADGTDYPVIVAVIDTGLDWNHKDFDWDRIWLNQYEIPDNGIDDDGNGYVDDIIGWNVAYDNKKPWDEDGHGTFVAGVIGATSNNGIGIAGINRGVKIMVLKALDTFGYSRASFLAEAIFYAANNGARVINISSGGEHLTKVEQEAIDYAHEMGAVIVVAAGNEAANTADKSPIGLRNIIGVATTDDKDKKANFSNWGQEIDIAAPGLDVLSLRARRTDLMEGITGFDEYSLGQAFVGEDTSCFNLPGM